MFSPYSQAFKQVRIKSRNLGTALAVPECVLELILNIRSCPTGNASMIQAFAALMFEAKVQRGCVDCQLYAEPSNPQSLHYVEQWSTLEDLESQLRSQRFGMLLATMETAAEAPKLEVRTVSDQRGLDYVRTVRLISGEHPILGWTCDPIPDPEQQDLKGKQVAKQ